ncbi:MAG TPA: EAL domain-containing protein [Steroidobacteraceae bacterium]|jgi:diguanylate cyclase (GGDEF)-like protein/PAS domain S-box-containing protein|nr:EAL domain-containing protein [Steroidobacteraceae bacterium]
MSILGLVCLLLALIATLLLVLYALQRREMRSVEQLSHQLQRIAIGGRLEGRVELRTDHPEIAALGTAINHLLTRSSGARLDLESGSGSPQLFAELADRIHEAVIVHRDVVLHANKHFAILVGAEKSALVGRSLADLVPPAYAELVQENIRRRLKGEAAAERYEIDMVGLQGQVSRLEISSTVIDYEGEPALLITGAEILPTQTVPQLAQLSVAADAGAAPTLHLQALSSLAEAVIVTDVQGHIRYMNPAAERLTGTAVDAAEERTLEQVVGFVDENDRRLLSDPLRQALTSGAAVNLSRRALLLSRANGAERSIELSAAPIRNDANDVTGAVALLHDVTELRGLARQMSYQATHDALTGLINRRDFERRCEEAIDRGQRGDGQHVLCYLDLDRFKSVNDTSGHLAGDSMLREVAKLLRDAVRDSDTVGRLGGDEFGMLLIGCPLEKAQQIADDVCRSVGDYRFVWKDKIFNIGVSVGIVEISRESGTLDELFAAADSACYVAKKQGSGRVAVYSARDEAHARHSGEIQWLQRLQSALKEDRFHLYQQIIVPANGPNGGGPAMEVLVRMRDEAGNDVPPIEFVRAAERYRLMGLVDRWVVQTTLAALGRGALPVPTNRSVAINISAQTLGDVQFLEFVVECLDSTGVTPGQVCFEITENAVIANMDHARRFVGVLHGMGCQFALDNFGSGVGSFSNLKNLPMDYLKIDGSFMRNLARDSVNQAMVTAMIKLARSLHFKVIAEQVEDDAAVDAARRMGVDFLQGFAIGKPEPLALAA